MYSRLMKNLKENLTLSNICFKPVPEGAVAYKKENK